MENEKRRNTTLMDLPESAMDCILRRLPPLDLYQTSQVCTRLRNRCTSNDMWKKHIDQKWGRVIGDVAYKEWRWHIAKAKGEILTNHCIQNESMGSFTGSWPNLCLGSYLKDCSHFSESSCDSFLMALYFSLESGNFWFPAQIYQGLMLRNALVSYDCKTDTFKARKQDGDWELGINIKWDRLRVTPPENSAHAVHISSCLDDLKPGDHIEIQWRDHQESLFDWCHAVIGHLESCDENENTCHCRYSEMLVVEPMPFLQLSFIRKITLSRRSCGEHSDIYGGFYGGIRKLQSPEELERWEKLFTRQSQLYENLQLEQMYPVDMNFEWALRF